MVVHVHFLADEILELPLDFVMLIQLGHCREQESGSWKKRIFQLVLAQNNVECDLPDLLSPNFVVAMPHCEEKGLGLRSRREGQVVLRDDTMVG